MVKLRQLTDLLNQTLAPERFKDYCPNGLQVEGRADVKKLITGVTASQAFLEAAIAQGADAVLVHHGYFWNNEDPCLRGIKQRRIKTLLLADVSLLAYHLPLDVHPQWGNNQQLAQRLGLQEISALYPHDPKIPGVWGTLPAISAESLAEQLRRLTGGVIQHIAGSPHRIHRLGLCTGAAQSMLQQAIELELDAFISGEISEPTVHLAQESGVHYFAAGHHATERYGVQALGAWVAEQLGIEHVYVDCPVPV